MIHASGFTPYRILPEGECPDQAGRILHDNLCPHVKRILDRAMSNDLPKLSGMIFMNSCDAMRRLANAWQRVRPDIEGVLIDLPTTTSEEDTIFLKGEMERLRGILDQWSGVPQRLEKLAESIRLYNQMAGYFEELRTRVKNGTLQRGAQLLQETYLKASGTAPEMMVKELKALLSTKDDDRNADGVPIYLFGNVMPEAETFALFASCGVRIMGEDLCTGSRLFTEIIIDPDNPADMLAGYARGLLNRPPCARTLSASQPGKLALDIVTTAKQYQASGVIGYTVKFCDPYIARLPGIRAALKREGIPFLMLEGDCTVRSIGQQKTRIEAFIEMLR